MATSGVGAAIGEMARFFLPRCRERATLLELERMAAEPVQWRHGHGLFGRIRAKSLRADDAGDRLLQAQYSFEEICAKTLFNLSDHFDPGYKGFPAPFDDDSPFWVVPLAVGFARVLGIDDPYSVSSLLRPTAEGTEPRSGGGR